MTRLTEIKGKIELQPGVAVSQYFHEEQKHELPFDVMLLSFEIDRYPASDMPRNFTSLIKVNEDTLRVSMNKIGEYDGWRFYQSGYDGKGGSVLMLNRDLWGIALVYTGYALFALSGLLWLMRRLIKFRMFLIFIIISLPLYADAFES